MVLLPGNDNKAILTGDGYVMGSSGLSSSGY